MKRAFGEYRRTSPPAFLDKPRIEQVRSHPELGPQYKQFAPGPSSHKTFALEGSVVENEASYALYNAIVAGEEFRRMAANAGHAPRALRDDAIHGGDASRR